MLSHPASRSRLITVLRKVAMTRGAFPVRTCERSSSKVTSRTQCSWFSIPQCSWTQAASAPGLAMVASAEVIR